jgi:hypothetical protein
MALGEGLIDLDIATLQVTISPRPCGERHHSTVINSNRAPGIKRVPSESLLNVIGEADAMKL